MDHQTAAPKLSQRNLLAAAVGLALTSLASHAMADGQGKALQLDSVTVDGKRDKSYKVERSSSVKYAVPLLDTP